MITVLIAAALIVSAAGNAVMGIMIVRFCSFADALLRMIPEYRERGTVGTPRIYSPYIYSPYEDKRDKLKED